MIAVDAALIQEISVLRDVKSDVYERVITAGFDILEGNQNTKAKDDLKYLVELIEESNGLKVSPAALQRVLLSIATLQWECAKLASKDIRMLHETLRQVGLWEEMIISFINVFSLHRSRIAAVKSSLGLPCPSYKHLSWRLDIELARRNNLCRMQPEYLLSLEVVDRSLRTPLSTSMTPTTNSSTTQSTSSPQRITKSYRLKASYAAMTALLSALQAAADEMKSVHCQRLQRYLS